MVANNLPDKELRDRIILIRGAGEMASGIACRLYQANFCRILLLETEAPLAVRRLVSFCEAVHQGSMSVEGLEAVRISREDELPGVWASGRIAVLVDHKGESLPRIKPDIFLDATVAKRNLGTSISDAPLVITLGPGFTAGLDCHVVIETNRGHNLGRLIIAGSAEANTSIPGDIGGYTSERVLRAPAAGLFNTEKQIGDLVRKGEVIGRVEGFDVVSQIDGILRGLIKPGSAVRKGLKIGDVDPRGEAGYCETVSEKARALGGAVLTAILSVYNR